MPPTLLAAYLTQWPTKMPSHYQWRNGNPPPPSLSKARAQTTGKLKPDGDFDINRGAAMTGTKVVKDRTNINGYVKGVS